MDDILTTQDLIAQAIKSLDVTKELIYIMCGALITYVFVGAGKVINSLNNGKSISLAYLMLALCAPLIVWQFAYEFPNSLIINETNVSRKNIFCLSLVSLVNISILMMIMGLIFPPSKILYTTENEDFREYLKKSRRPFYFLVMIYLASITFSNMYMHSEIPMPIGITRGVIFLYALIGSFLNFEKSTKNLERLNVNMRFPKLKIEKGKSSLSIKKDIVFFYLFNVKTQDRETLKDNIYDNLDLIFSSIIVLGFFIIMITRNI